MMNTRLIRLILSMLFVNLCSILPAQSLLWPPQISSYQHYDLTVTSGTVQRTQVSIYRNESSKYIGDRSRTLVVNDSPATQTVGTSNGQPIVLTPQEARLFDGNTYINWLGLWNSSYSSVQYDLFLTGRVNRSYLYKIPTALPGFSKKIMPLPDPGRVLPSNAEALSMVKGIFLDGQEAKLSPAQIEALDAWIAAGGVLFLDAQALQQLQGAKFAQGVRTTNAPAQRVDLTPLANYLKPFAPVAPADVNNTYGYGGYGQYGAKPKKKAPLTQPASAPVKAEPMFVDVSGLEFSDEVRATLQTTGSPVALAAWRYGLGIISVQAFKGAGSETLMQEWVAVQCVRSSFSSNYFLNNFRYAAPLEAYMSEKIGDPQINSAPDWIAHVLLAITIMPGISRVWSLLAFFPAVLFVLAMAGLFLKRRRWYLAMGVLAGVALIFSSATFSAAGRTTILQTYERMFTPLPHADWQIASCKVQETILGPQKPQPAHVLLKGYPLAELSFDTRDLILNTQQDQNIGADFPLLPITPRPDICWSDSNAQRSATVAATAAVLRKKTGEVKIIVDEDSKDAFRGRIINETGYDLKDAEASVTTQKDQVEIVFPRVWQTGNTIEFYKEYTKDKKNVKDVSSSGKNDIYYRYSGNFYGKRLGMNGFFKAKFSQKPKEPTLFEVMDRPTWKQEESLIVQPLYADARTFDEAAASQAASQPASELGE